MLEMKVPSPGESITEVEIATWLVKDGDYVEKDQAIAEVDSDKATLELPAEEAGIIYLKAEEGDVVEVGQVVCHIDTAAAKPAGNAAPAAEAPKAEVKEEVKAAPAPVATPAPAAPAATYATGTPSPAAKKVLDEKGVDAAQVVGSGRDGRITQQDAVRFTPAMGTAPVSGSRSSSEKKLSSLRRKIAQRLVSVKNETAMLTTFNEVDMSAIFALRNEYKDAFKAKHGVGLGFMSFFTKAVTRALELYPDVNSMIDGDYQVKFDYADVSVAVSGPKGLMVPVVRNAENLTFRGVEQSIKDLAIKVRDGKISVDEMTGGTFTITNGGVFGSMMSTPIINPPQSGILGMHNIVERPIAKNGQVVIAPMMYIALSYDHRVIDGRESVGFLVAVKEAIEDPLNVLMGGDAKKALEL
ncbi:2-oxoglutarate dehydrogenase complex dihydrolipoyllysine-residue succinyltransferase [Faecalibacter rhinopitheci]|uniref:Dihydrolipoyllysine-residue succinyltransferase component of 2-oxoglutarate dehydrogenase complex n=1 Tax=Faecalibacter rhinopitheci TaxID=2779678 RepID=A0A8J7K4W2_9FLAO|nr:2-oxoglutarate dehydrogenase complex dihydrolipoyllysine-residue succinyltransferase [Faecalibacter rhinopitheci]MBF0597908.1 2-oxoglutarate dehydrogenase complex dihydrolipoyllysine-residue succinyltransferase [Faecalibacter rhinopitheci]MBQ0148689.1 2-oxoglutarate dehydrogenase complex dihydrolipoyllysine-residue succinyltransferase [Candidatus Onthonaster equi]